MPRYVHIPSFPLAKIKQVKAKTNNKFHAVLVYHYKSCAEQKATADLNKFIEPQHTYTI